MKKKLFSFIVLFVCLFGLVGCTTTFCNDEDVSNIKQGILNQLDTNTGTGNYATPNSTMLEQAEINSSYLSDLGISNIPESITWDYISTLENSSVIKAKYVDYVYEGKPSLKRAYYRCISKIFTFAYQHCIIYKIIKNLIIYLI